MVESSGPVQSDQNLGWTHLAGFFLSEDRTISGLSDKCESNTIKLDVTFFFLT